jgi:hypothetical protein
MALRRETNAERVKRLTEVQLKAEKEGKNPIAAQKEYVSKENAEIAKGKRVVVEEETGVTYLVEQNRSRETGRVQTTSFKTLRKTPEMVEKERRLAEAQAKVQRGEQLTPRDLVAKGGQTLRYTDVQNIQDLGQASEDNRYKKEVAAMLEARQERRDAKKQEALVEEGKKILGQSQNASYDPNKKTLFNQPSLKQTENKLVGTGIQGGTLIESTNSFGVKTTKEYIPVASADNGGTLYQEVAKPEPPKDLPIEKKSLGAYLKDEFNSVGKILDPNEKGSLAQIALNPQTGKEQAASFILQGPLISGAGKFIGFIGKTTASIIGPTIVADLAETRVGQAVSNFFRKPVVAVASSQTIKGLGVVADVAVVGGSAIVAGGESYIQGASPVKALSVASTTAVRTQFSLNLFGVGYTSGVKTAQKAEKGIFAQSKPKIVSDTTTTIKSNVALDTRPVVKEGQAPSLQVAQVSESNLVKQRVIRYRSKVLGIQQEGLAVSQTETKGYSTLKGKGDISGDYLKTGYSVEGVTTTTTTSAGGIDVIPVKKSPIRKPSLFESQSKTGSSFTIKSGLLKTTGKDTARSVGILKIGEGRAARVRLIQSDIAVTRGKVKENIIKEQEISFQEPEPSTSKALSPYQRDPFSDPAIGRPKSVKTVLTEELPTKNKTTVEVTTKVLKFGTPGKTQRAPVVTTVFAEQPAARKTVIEKFNSNTALRTEFSALESKGISFEAKTQRVNNPGVFKRTKGPVDLSGEGYTTSRSYQIAPKRRLGTSAPIVKQLADNTVPVSIRRISEKTQREFNLKNNYGEEIDKTFRELPLKPKQKPSFSSVSNTQPSGGSSSQTIFVEEEAVQQRPDVFLSGLAGQFGEVETRATYSFPKTVLTNPTISSRVVVPTTISQVRPIQTTFQGQQYSLKSQSQLKVESKLKSDVTTQLKSDLALAVKPVSAYKLKSDVLLNQKSDVLLKQNSDVLLKQKSELVIKPVTETVIRPSLLLRPAQILIVKTVSTVIGPPPPVVTPKYFYMDVPSRPLAQKGFNVFVRRQGKFQQVNVGSLSYTEAKAFGANVVQNTAAATFKVTPGGAVSGSYSGFGSFADFYKKGEQFIQKRSKRIGTVGEKREITYKGIAARRGSKFGTVFK